MEESKFNRGKNFIGQMKVYKFRGISFQTKFSENGWMGLIGCYLMGPYFLYEDLIEIYEHILKNDPQEILE